MGEIWGTSKMAEIVNLLLLKYGTRPIDEFIERTDLCTGQKYYTLMEIHTV